MSNSLPLLSEPQQPGLLRQCPSCQCYFALRAVRTETDKRVGQVSVYVCRHCEREVKFAERLPPHAV